VKSAHFIAITDFFLKRPWFRRAWTFQERFLAREKSFYCGDFYISQPKMSYFLARLRDRCVEREDPSYSFASDRILTLSVTDINRESLGSRGSLLHQFSGRLGSSCKDPSDLVYSLLRTTDDIWKATIQPDYQKPFQVVYAETAVLIIQSSGALSVFGEVDSAVLPCSLLPSWCPDWRRPYQTEQHWSLTGLSFGF
jgi:hypothetical protein